MRKTNEGGNQYNFSMDHHLEFFSKAGSLLTKRQSSYGQEESALSLFQKCWVVDKELALRLLFWLRDIRGGAGNRSGSRECYRWLAENDPKWLRCNLYMLPEIGRWDDLRSLFSTKLESESADFWVNEILLKKNVLAAKWADRNDKPLFYNMRARLPKLNIGDFRRMLAKVRKEHIVEHKMCTDRWNEIEYHTVPSIAMARYTNAFTRHDADRFVKFKEKVKSGEIDIKAEVLFPHDCVRTANYGDREVADLQFDALPNYMENTDEKIIVISDISGSMSVPVSGAISAFEVSQSLALYCSAKIPEENPFYKRFLTFESESEFKNWEKYKFSDAVNSRKLFDGGWGGTRIDKALNLILDTANFLNLSQDQMPTMLIIVSDMQFHDGVDGDGTEVEKCMELWDIAGYNRPKIIYWNTAGYAGSPDTVKSDDIGLVSGFSPAILKAILGGVDFSPMAIMFRALEKYTVNIP